MHLFYLYRVACFRLWGRVGVRGRILLRQLRTHRNVAGFGDSVGAVRRLQCAAVSEPPRSRYRHFASSRCQGARGARVYRLTRICSLRAPTQVEWIPAVSTNAAATHAAAGD